MNIAAARHQLGMSLREFAAAHQMSVAAARRWEKPKDSSGYREPSGSTVAFTQALLDGYRPTTNQTRNPT